MKLFKFIPLYIGLVMPIVASAQTTINDILIATVNVLRNAVPVAFGVIILLFLWGLAKYMLQVDTVEGREGAKQIMIWGVVAIFVVASLWGFVELLIDITGANPPATTWPQIAP